MAAPQYVPSTLEEMPRRGLPIPPPDRWLADRPGELGPDQPVGPMFGNQGPDQGFALKLVRRFLDRVVATPEETADDVTAGILAVATKRSSIFGRAPVVHDAEIAFRLWGFLDSSAPAELVERRRPLFIAAAHHYDQQRAIADAVPEATLRLTPIEVAGRAPADWVALLHLG